MLQQRLCVSTWRGQLSAGSAVVFSSCAPSSGAGASASTDDREARAQRVTVERVTEEATIGKEFRFRVGELCVSAHADGVEWTY